MNWKKYKEEKPPEGEGLIISVSDEWQEMGDKIIDKL